MRDVRNQGVLLRGVNDSAGALLDLCFALLDGAGDHALLLLPVRHDPGRRALAADRSARRRRCSRRSWATCPGSRPRAWSATCRTWASAGCTRWPGTTPSCGISYWTKGYRTAIEAGDPLALDREYPYYDPIHLLPESGQDVVARPGGPGEACRGPPP